ncbi:choice-of-anchor Q domain-containing protein, partial [Escherichia coli]
VDETDANIHDAPGFVHPASGDYHLTAASPLVDAGDPAVASQADFDGLMRSIDGNGDGTATPDIGAFEVPAKVIPPVAPPVDPPTAPGGT